MQKKKKKKTQLSSTRSPPPANRPQSTHYAGGGAPGAGSAGLGRAPSHRVVRPPGAAEGGGWDNLGCDVPPPLPARNRSLVSQHSSPMLLDKTHTENHHHLADSGLTTSASSGSLALGAQAPPPPPPLPPRNAASNASGSSSCSTASTSNDGSVNLNGYAETQPSSVVSISQLE